MPNAVGPTLQPVKKLSVAPQRSPSGTRPQKAATFLHERAVNLNPNLSRNPTKMADYRNWWKTFNQQYDPFAMLRGGYQTLQNATDLAPLGQYLGGLGGGGVGGAAFGAALGGAANWANPDEDALRLAAMGRIPLSTELSKSTKFYPNYAPTYEHIETQAQGMLNEYLKHTPIRQATMEKNLNKLALRAHSAPEDRVYAYRTLQLIQGLKKAP